MSATHQFPPRHLNLLTNSSCKQPNFSSCPSITDRVLSLLEAIEKFLLTCTSLEMCRFWKAVHNLRQSLSKKPDIPQFLNNRRKKRSFIRILEVLANLPYPKMHLSEHLLPSQYQNRH
jgi:hypothetical protein